MKSLKVFLLSFLLLFAFGMATAQEETVILPATAEIEEIIALDEDIAPETLGVSEPTLLPDNPFYFFKSLGRTIQTVFTFDPVKKAELKEKFANEKLMEVKKMVEQNKNREKIEKAVRNYQQEIEEMAKVTETIREKAEESVAVGKFLDKFIQQQILHQRVLQKLEEQVPAEVVKKIAEARETHVEKFGEVMTRLENAEKIPERLENNLQAVKGSEFKEFKNLEILKDLEEKVPEVAKEAVQQVRANTLIKLKEEVKEMTTEKIEQFQAYTEKIAGVKEKQVEILDNLREELKAVPEAKETILQSRGKIMEQVREKITESNCPEIEKPAATFCREGRVLIKKDNSGCVISFDCVMPAETETPTIKPTEGQACITLWDPVCGKNGKTYSNECFVKQANVEIDYKGACRSLEAGESTQLKERLQKVIPQTIQQLAP